MTHFFPRQCFKALVLGFCSLFSGVLLPENLTSQPYHDAPAPEQVSLGHIEGSGARKFHRIYLCRSVFITAVSQ